MEGRTGWLGPRSWVGEWWLLPLLVITVIGTVLRSPDEPFVSPASWAGILGTAAVLALLLRWWHPEATVVLNAVTVAIYFGVGLPDGPIYLSVLLSAYALTRRRSIRQAWPYVVGALVVVGVALTLRASINGRGFRVAFFGETTWFVAIVLAAAAIGVAARSRGLARREQANRAASEEQLRMAQELHDGVGHGLAVIAMQAGVALHLLEKDRAKARESLLAIRETSRESLDSLRAELTRLAGDQIPRRPRNGIDALPALVDRVRAGGLDVSLVRRHGELPDAIGEVSYRVVQEALTNVLRHAGAAVAQVSVVERPGDVLVSVVDDGQGGVVHEGVGLGGMRARVHNIGGTLAVGPGPEGFTVQARIPTGMR